MDSGAPTCGIEPRKIEPNMEPLWERLESLIEALTEETITLTGRPVALVLFACPADPQYAVMMASNAKEVDIVPFVAEWLKRYK